MLTTDDALGRMIADTSPLPAITVQLLDGLGCILAADAVARVAQGQDAVFLPAGTCLTTRHLPRLVAAGVSEIDIVPRPRVVVISLTEGSLGEANHSVMASACIEAGAQVYRVVGSDDRAMRDVIEDQLVRADLVLIASDDLHGLATDLSELGDVQVHDLSVSPTMSVGYGRIGEESVQAILLPGRPLLTYLAFELFVRPVIRSLALDPRPFRHPVRAKAVSAWQPPPGIQELRLGALTVADGMYAFVPTPDGDPSLMLASSDAVAIVPAGKGEVVAGNAVLVLPFEGLPT